MNKKKLLALFMSLVMILTLMPMTAFATEPCEEHDFGTDGICTACGLSQYPKGAVEYLGGYHQVRVQYLDQIHADLYDGQQADEDGFDYYGVVTPPVAYTFAAVDDPNLNRLDAFSGYNCDFVVSITGGVDAYSFGLFGNYGSFGDIAFFAPIDVGPNEEIPLLGSVAKVPWTYESIANIVGSFTCGAFNTAKENLGKTFTVKLVLWPDNDNESQTSYADADPSKVIVVSRTDYVIDTVSPLYRQDTPYIYKSDDNTDGGFMISTGETYGEGTPIMLSELESYDGPHYAPIIATVSVDGKESGFTSLAEAVTFANASTGSVTTITLLSDCSTGDATIAAPIALTKENATLDLNGNTITVNNNFSFIMAADGITVKDGTIVSADNPAKRTGYNSYILVIGGAGKTDVVSDVKLNHVTMLGGLSVGGSEDAAYKGIARGVELENCNITSGDYYAVCSQNHSDVTIKSGTYVYNKAVVHSGGSSGLSVLEGCFVGSDGPEGSIIVEGGYFNGPINTDNYNNANGRYVTLKGGYYTESPYDKLVADGYEAVTLTTSKEVDSVTYTHQVGEIKATELTKDEGTATTDSATYSATKTVIDTENENNVLSTGATITVDVTANQDDVVDKTVETKAPAVLANLTQEAMNEIVQIAVANAPVPTEEEAPHVDVEILVVKSAAVTTDATENVPKRVTYEVHPEAIIKVDNTQVDKVRLDNGQLAGTFTFKLDVSDITQDGQVNLYHQHGDEVEYLGTHNVSGGEITVKGIRSFSQFIAEPVTSSDQSVTVGVAGASLRRRVKINNPNAVVNTSTDFRVTFQWTANNVTVKPTESYFMWSSDGGAHWVQVPVKNYDNNQVSLVITGIPREAFDTNISTKLHLVYGDDSVDITAPTYSVNGIADALAGRFSEDSEGRQWGDYGRYLRSGEGDYLLSTYAQNNG